MDTTKAAADEIRGFLSGAEIASQRLEQLILDGNITGIAQLDTIKALQSRSSETYALTRTLSKQQHGIATSLHTAFSTTCTTLAQATSAQARIERWIRKIVQYCKDLIAMVQRNTHLLLSLHGTLARLERLLHTPGLNLPILEFENSFGIKMALPFQLCDTWEVNAYSPDAD